MMMMMMMNGHLAILIIVHAATHDTFSSSMRWTLRRENGR